MSVCTQRKTNERKIYNLHAWILYFLDLEKLLQEDDCTNVNKGMLSSCLYIQGVFIHFLEQTKPLL